MSLSFTDKFSRDFDQLLENDTTHNVVIKTGSRKNTHEFYAHSMILRARSTHFRTARYRKSRDGLMHFTKPNISPDVFRIILRYIYTGVITLKNETTANILSLLEAAQELQFEELLDPVQTFIIDNHTPWLRRHLATVHRIAFRHKAFRLMQKFFDETIRESPELVFRSDDFCQVDEQLLVSLLVQEELHLHESEIWDHVIRWGRAQSASLAADTSKWSTNDFKTLESHLKQCLPLIRFFNISPANFRATVNPYRPILSDELCEQILLSHETPDSEPTIPTLSARRGPIDSLLFNTRQAAQIATWIEKGVHGPNNAFYAENNPYTFRLLLRGTRDGFTPEIFHKLCDRRGPTVTLVKLAETGELLGGYNPKEWCSPVTELMRWGRTGRSFVFSLGDGVTSKPIVSRVKNPECAVGNSSVRGPWFGEADFGLRGNFQKDCASVCRQVTYERNIRNTTDHFSIEEYEVFYVVKTSNEVTFGPEREPCMRNDGGRIASNEMLMMCRQHPLSVPIK